MGIAANAVAELAGPPPPRAAANANDDANDAASFQDHVDASDRTQGRDDRAPPNDDAHPAPSRSSDQAVHQSASQSEDRSEETTTQARQAGEDHADAKSDAAAPPIFLQLIANAIAPMLGAKAAPSAPQPQQASQATPAEQAQAQANDAQAISAQAAGLANTTTPIKISPKTDARPAPVKIAKGATEKTEAASETPAVNAALEAAASAPPTEAGAPAVLANPARQDGAKLSDAKSSAGSNAVDGIQAAPSRAGPPHEARQAPPATSAPPLAPETPAQANSAEAKPRDAGKALAPTEALKQAAQDFAPAAPKAQPSSTQPATLSAHPQLAATAEQGSTTNAHTQAPPVALQVGGEIIRRFTGADTSFQLRLDPPDLGRVDVRLDVSRDHRVTAVFSADSPQALSDLARGARDLQLALQSAGLDLADDGLRFDLSSNGQGNAFAQAQAQQDQTGLRAANGAHATIAPEIAPQRPLSIDRWRGARVDLMA